MVGLLTCESSSSQQMAGVPQIGKFSLSLARSATAIFRSDTGCHVCGKKASRKSFLYLQKKKIVLVSAVIRRLSQVKRQKVRLRKT